MTRTTHSQNTSYLEPRPFFGLLILFVLSLSACKQDTSILPEGDDFSSEISASAAPEILGVTPSDATISVGLESLVFGIAINGDAGKAIYTYKIDGIAIWQSYSGTYNYSPQSLSSGAHTFTVEVENSFGNTSHTFNLYKNTEPTITSKTPAIATGHLINCGGPSSYDIDLSITTSDFDGDSLVYYWSVNDIVNDASLTVSDGLGLSDATFTPTCAYKGNNEIKVSVSDGVDVVSFTWYIDVQDPIVAQVTGIFPTSNPIVIPASSNQSVSVFASGKPPLAYTWKMDGVVIPGETAATINISGGSYVTGNYTLTVEVADADSNDSHDFNLRINGPPGLSDITPSTPFSLNYQTQQIFNVDATDPNGDSLTYTWKLNNLPSAALTPTGDESQATFTPNLSYLGNNTISVSVSDGSESTSYEWTVNVNYYSDACNNLGPGEICTVVGQVGVGSGAYPSTENSKINMSPRGASVDKYGNLYIADFNSHLIWYYNRSDVTSSPGTDVTVLGTLVKAGQAKVVVGTGTYDTFGSADGTLALNWAISYPRALATYDKNSDGVDDYLFVSEYGEDRIVRFDIATGIGYGFLGTHSSVENCSTNTDGLAANTQVCADPGEIAIDESSGTLYVTCYANDNIKKVILNDDISLTQTYILVGETSSCTTIAGTVDGTLGSSGTSRIRQPYGLALDKTGNLYISDIYTCSVKVVNFSGGPLNYFGGGVTAPSNQLTTLFGGICGNTEGTSFGAVLFDDPYGLELLENYVGASSGVDGFLVNSSVREKIIFVNNSPNAITLGGTTISSYFGDRMAGTITSGFSGDSGLASSAKIGSTPYGITLAQDSLFIMDTYNKRVRAVDITPGSPTEGQINTLLGSGNERSDFDTQTALTIGPNEARLNNPRQVLFDASNNRLLIADTYNDTIRSLDILTGTISPLIGDGNTSGNADTEGTAPNATNVFNVGDMAFMDNFLLYTEYYSSIDGANKNSMARAWNFSATTINLFGNPIDSDTVRSFASNYLTGAAYWEPAFNGTDALNVPQRSLNSITSDGSRVYLASSQNNCIQKIDTDGKIYEYIGTCGNGISYYGDIDATLISGNARLRNPTYVLSDPLYEANGNLFVLDQNSTVTNNKVKYLNLTGSPVMVLGDSVAAGEISTIWASVNTGLANGLALFGNKICISQGHESYASYGSHNVKCYDRTNPTESLEFRIGGPDSPIDARTPLADEQEGISGTSARLYTPMGLAFDGDGNLYIVEIQTGTIRKVKKWW